MFEQNDASRTNEPVALQPMNFTDILDGTFSLYRNHFRLFFGILAVDFVATFCLNLLFKLSVSSSTPPDRLLAMSFVNVFAVFLVALVVYGAIFYAGAQLYLGRQLTPGAALQQAFRRFWQYLGSGILWFLVVGGLGITIIGIPFAIYLSIRWELYSLPVLFEETKIREAFRRSSQLVKGSWWRVFGITFALFLLWFMLFFILNSTAGFALSLGGAGTTEGDLGQWLLRTWIGPDVFKTPFLPYAAQMFLHVLFNTVTFPILIIGSTLLYFDLRIRKEGYDIEMMASSEQSD